MRILYGVCGEGLGHSSRAKVIIKHLIKKGHKVLVMTYGQAYPVMRTNFNTIKIEGIHLQFEKNQLSLSKTFLQAIKSNVSNLRNIKKIKKAINSFSLEICITDFEPITAIISFWRKIPLISIDNQHRLTHLNLKVPKKYIKEYIIAKKTTELCVSKADAFIILSFTKQKSRARNIFIVNPILRNEITKLKPSNKKFILAYLTKPNDSLIKILKALPEKFILYGYNKEKQEGNIIYKKTSHSFLKDLAKCKAVIATTGFSLMSESIYLKKPYFAIPLKGQFEQMLNALFLNKSGFGTYSENPTKNDIEKFIKNLAHYKNNLKKYKSNPNEVFDVLDKIINRI